MPEYLQNLLLIFYLGISFVLVLYIPGYALSYWLFKPDTLDRLERVFVAMATSIALSSLTGFGLIRLSGSLHPDSFVLVTLVGTALFAAGALWRSRPELAGRNTSLKDLFINQKTIIKQFSKPGYHLRIIPLVLFFVIVVSVIDGTSLRGTFSPELTEFYIAPQYLDEVLETELNGQDSILIPLAIANREEQPITYRIETKIDGRSLMELSGITVNSDAVWQETLTIPVSDVEDRVLLELSLFSNQANVETAQLRLWLGADQRSDE